MSAAPLAFDRPSSSAAGDAASEGYSAAAARADHKHAREAADANLSSAAGSVAQIDIGDTASAGSSTLGARVDHQHALPAPAAASTSAVADAAAAGTAATVARADHVHGREAFATTSDIADIAATESAGTAATVPHGDHVHALSSLGAWQTYTPALQASTTNPTLGTGSTVRGRYVQHGKTVIAEIFIAFGSSGTAAGSGTYRVTLPVTNQAGTANTLVGHGWVKSAGTYTRVEAFIPLVSSAYVEMRYPNAVVGGTLITVNNTNPGAWTASDEIRLLVEYETT